MTTAFPRAVLIDEDRHHHYAVWVHNGSGTITAACVDCLDVVEMPIRMAERLKELLRNDDDVQVIAWVEDNE